MVLNPVQIEGIFYLFLTVPIAIAFIITVHHYLRYKSRPSLYFAMAWLNYVIWGLANGFVFFLNVPIFGFIGAYITIPLAIFTVLFFDSISREDVSLVKMLVVTILSTAKFVLLLQPDAIQSTPYPGGFERLTLNIPLMILGSLLTTTLGLWYVYYTAQIHRNAPKKMKYYSGMCLGGAITMGLVGPLISLFSANFPIIINVGIGALLTSIAFTRQSHLAYILPFKLFRLTVVDNSSGIHLFTHVWNPDSEFINPNLFSGVLQGITGILQESLRKGFPREINLDYATILINRSEEIPVTFVLIASRSSSYLRQALQTFTEHFSRVFKGSFSTRKRVVIADFTPAEGLVAISFPFIP